MGPAALRHGFHQHMNAARFAGARRPQRHHAVTHVLRLEQLDQLEDPGRVVDQAILHHLARNVGFMLLRELFYTISV